MSELATGFSDVTFSSHIRPQDDLFRHVNGPWFEATPIPDDKSSYGTFWQLAENSEMASRAICEECVSAQPGTLARKIGDLYSSFLDEEAVEACGVGPLAERLGEVDLVVSVEDLMGLLGRLEREGVSGLYHVYVDNDPGNPERYLPFFEQGGLSLPDERYYRDDAFVSIRQAFVRHVAKMFELVGLDNPEGRAERVLELETRIAGGHWDNVTSRDAEKTYNLTSWLDARTLFAGGAPVAGLESWAEGLGASAGVFAEVVLRQPSYTKELSTLLVRPEIENWREWLRYRVIVAEAPLLTREIAEANFDFYGRTLSGTPEMRARWKRAVSLVEGSMGEALGQLYVERHFPPQAKERMDELVVNLVEAYRQSITSLEWMSEATKSRALEKLDAFTPKIGYPPRWRDYEGLEVVAGDVVGNARRAARFEHERQLAKIGRPLDRDEWFMTPQTVNAYYNPGFNEIVFPAAILQPPFFDLDRDDAANYGAIGAVIGHEIGHGFDDQGSKFDGEGRLRDWWTNEDRTAFEALTARLVAQFDNLHPRVVPDQHVNGALTLGENIGDLGGLGIAWRAYQISLAGEEPPVIDGLTGAQRFFLAWALGWRHQARPEEAERLLTIDPHSPPEFRCNQIVRNLDPFYEAFGVSEADELWLEPAQRVAIW